MGNIVVLGDSITYHPIVGGLWCGAYGMAATEQAADWFNLVEAAHPEHTWYNTTRDEGSFAFIQLAAQLPTIYSAVTVDALIIQVAEHAYTATVGLGGSTGTEEKGEAEINAWMEIVGDFCRTKGAKLVCLSRLLDVTSPPYDPDTGIGLIDRQFKAATEAQNGYWIDLSWDVNAVSGSTGDDPCNDPELASVQGHPNDTGMQRIATTVSAWISANMPT